MHHPKLGFASRHTACALAIAATLISPYVGAEARQLLAQQVRVVQVPGDIACSSCRIELRRVVVLTEPAAGPGIIRDSPIVTTDSRGNWYLISEVASMQVAVFNARGEFVRVLGGAGQGPGEFRAVRAMAVGSQDTLFVYDFSLRRRTVFAPDFAFVRVENVPGPVGSALALPNGNHVINSSIGETGSVRHPLHLLSATGVIERSFAPYTYSQQGMVQNQIRFLASDSAGRIWSPWYNKYQVDLFSAAGEQLEQYNIDSRWWGSSTHPNSQLRGAAPSARDQNVLFLHSVFQNPAYVQAPRSPGDVSRRTAAQLDSLWDGMIEAVDRRSGRLLASLHVSPLYMPALGRFVPVVKVLDDGSTVVEVFEPVLIRAG